MKITSLPLAFLLLSHGASAGSFQNLDFEQVSDAVDWDVSVAAWEGIYYDAGNGGLFRVNAINAGAVSWPTITSPSAIDGQYSMGFLTFSNTPQVGVAQTATLGADDQWLILLTDLNRTDGTDGGTQGLEIYFNDSPVHFDLFEAELNGKPLWRLKADLRSFAGLTGTLKILADFKAADVYPTRINVDNLQLVPEPDPIQVALALGTASLASIVALRSRRLNSTASAAQH